MTELLKKLVGSNVEIQQELSQITVDSFVDSRYNGARRARALMLETLLHGIQKQEKRAAASETPSSSFFRGASQFAKACPAETSENWFQKKARKEGRVRPR